MKQRSLSFRETNFSLTEFGAAILSAEVSSFPTNPIDKWVGGVYLSSSSDNLWFFHDGWLIGENDLINTLRPTLP